MVQRFLEGALQIPISVGSTQAAWEEASAAVAAPYTELEAALPQEAVLNADETGHRTNGDKRWLWAFVARTFVLYRIAVSRGSDVLQTVLGETFAGVLGSDRLPSYLKYVAGQRQFCWAHLTRNVLSALDLATTPSAKRFCREALVLQRRLFRMWHRFRDDPTARGGPLTRQELIAKALPIEKAFFRAQERGGAVVCPVRWGVSARSESGLYVGYPPIFFAQVAVVPGKTLRVHRRPGCLPLATFR